MALKDVPGDGSQRHAQKLVTKPASPWPPNNQQNNSSFKLGPIWLFYQECQQLLSQLLKQALFSRTRPLRRKTKESITRFVLWGTGWSDGRLDVCLAGSAQLRNSVIEGLSGIAKALLRSIVFSGFSKGDQWLMTLSSMWV